MLNQQRRTVQAAKRFYMRVMQTMRERNGTPRHIVNCFLSVMASMPPPAEERLLSFSFIHRIISMPRHIIDFHRCHYFHASKERRASARRRC